MIEITKINEVYSHLKCDRSIAREVSEYFSFFVNGYKFMPSFRNKTFDGKIRLAKILSNGNLEFPIGLMRHLETFASENGYTLNLNYTEEGLNTVSRETLKKFVLNLNLHSNGNKIEIRDYQFDTVLNFLNTKRMIALSPTSSGKSLILYVIIRYLLEFKCKVGLVLVPNVSLCHQLASDFKDYSSHNGWAAEDNIHTIFSGKEKTSSKPIILSTWQSIFKNEKPFFKDFEFVVSDECHLSSSSSISSILNKCTNTQFRIGVTGTLNGTKVHSLQLEALFGAVQQVITTKQLMDANQIASLKIKCLVLKYPDEIRKALTKLTYQEEIDFIVSNVGRNRFIRNLALSLLGNTLVLFQQIKHGKVLYDLISNSKNLGNRKVYFISGNIDSLEREKIRILLESETDAILIGSVGTVATGMNAPSLKNIIFSHPSKSRVRNLQAAGRILRKNLNNDKAVLYDIADNLIWKKHVNFVMKHFAERIKIYNSEKFDYKIINIDLIKK
jgi:superfamily II DNA or RNA helicase